METDFIYELIGYVASVLVAVSLMMSSVLRLRIINLIGAITFTVYGLLITAYPVAAVNAFIILINLYHLRRMTGQEEYFKLLEIEPGSEFLRHFCETYREEMARYFPGFEGRVGEGDLALLVLRDVVPAGLLVGRVTEDGTLEVKVDYVIPGYRDLKVGEFLFDRRADYFRGRGISRVVATAATDDHAAYLRKMGFRSVEGDGVMERRIGEE
jgi:GNAT superfamily N-acetyltransferase